MTLMENPEDKFNLLKSFSVSPSLTNNYGLNLHWEWTTSELAHRLIEQIKVIYYSSTDMQQAGQLILEPLLQKYNLADLQPQKTYLVCLRLTRKRLDNHEPKNHIPKTMKSNRTDQMLNHFQFIQGTGSFLAEMKCAKATTRSLHFPAIISTIIGVLLAISFSIAAFLFLKNFKRIYRSKYSQSSSMQSSAKMKPKSQDGRVGTRLSLTHFSASTLKTFGQNNNNNNSSQMKNGIGRTQSKNLREAQLSASSSENYPADSPSNATDVDSVRSTHQNIQSNKKSTKRTVSFWVSETVSTAKIESSSNKCDTRISNLSEQNNSKQLDLIKPLSTESNSLSDDRSIMSYPIESNALHSVCSPLLTSQHEECESTGQNSNYQAGEQTNNEIMEEELLKSNSIPEMTSPYDSRQVDFETPMGQRICSPTLNTQIKTAHTLDHVVFFAQFVETL